ncbi:hypothetical protein FBF86_07050 [Serratia marcescens]|uniref:hypothetical protein n=1 Tax=Serratia marcescens TaxID=615 RepID=UPI00115037D9|nr:hypothetical protein [Serratia marcescens]QDI17740.1 hypothetical protein FBF86_07050 [Serratia marcescens]QDI27483.1 hypothetical protein FG169_07050 [Serratia marcescens]QDI41947.1 hypothetical protein FG172_07035 [Serratia marcescens]QDI56377.1 hypothetical protein FG175_07035 [Serratia marcescens]
MHQLLYYNISIYLSRLPAFCKSESQRLLPRTLREPRQATKAAPPASTLRGQSNIAQPFINDNDFHYQLSNDDFRLRIPANLVMFEAISFIADFQELT